MDSQAFLSSLGSRLRRAREESGRTASAVARDAGISRRYLTEAEAGRANPSILILARLGEVLDLSLGSLCELSRERHLGRVALVGLRGAGKSSVGRLLALDREATFVELDRRVEELAGLRLGEIFQLHGPDVFHRLEGEVLESVLAEGERSVIAAGGSIVDHPANFARLCDTCKTVWLRARPEEHFERVLRQGDHRPMEGHPRAMEELRSLLERREPLYQRCDIEISTSGLHVRDVSAEIQRLCAPA
ncbi:MAG: transcriptional regulator [Planctomycetes bacterium]|jgi:XRE family aerobic/anaerobic benzoate catabolism transcriptional regulator|nr:transcriptional regulator [Planctomycetota bacterium]